MSLHYYASHVQVKCAGTSVSGTKVTEGLDFRLASYRHDFMPADNGRMIHEIREMYAPYYNDKASNGMGYVQCILNEYISDEEAYELARRIRDNAYDQYVGVSHMVYSSPSRKH